MIGIDQIKQTINIMLHPKSATATPKGVKENFVWYYKLAVVPLIISILISVILFGIVGSVSSLFGLNNLLPGVGFTAAIVVLVVILYFLIFIPAGFLIGAAILHFFGKHVFRKFKEDYAHTLTAIVYESAPAVMLFWLYLIPVVGEILMFIVGIWNLVIYFYALSNQQKISKLAVLGITIGVWLIGLLLVFVIVMLFAAGSALAFPR